MNGIGDSDHEENIIESKKAEPIMSAKVEVKEDHMLPILTREKSTAEKQETFVSDRQYDTIKVQQELNINIAQEINFNNNHHVSYYII